MSNEQKLNMELNALRRQIKEIGAMIPVNTGGTMKNDPCDAILYTVAQLLSSAAETRKTP